MTTTGKDAWARYDRALTEALERATFNSLLGGTQASFLNSRHERHTMLDYKGSVNDKEYFECLENDPRPWWNELPPPKKTRLKNVRLTPISRLNKHNYGGHKLDK